GNWTRGIDIYDGASNNTIGGTATGAGNIIAHNANDGVRVSGDTGFGPSIGTAIIGNSIYDNSLGIDLEPSSGVTANDGAGDADIGANELQNFPDITDAWTNGVQVLIAGTLDSAANSTFRVEFFASSVASGFGYGEGEVYLGFADVTTDGLGNAIFSETLKVNVAVGAFITATATDSAGNTSEFSEADVTATASNDVLVVTNTSWLSNGDAALAIAAHSANDGGEGISLLEAIEAANATGNVGLPDYITFDIPLDDPGHVYYQDNSGAGWGPAVWTDLDDASITDFDPDLPGTPRSWYRIQYTSSVPALVEGVVIDATTQAGFSGEPLIELDLSGASGTDGFGGNNSAELTGGITIRGFIINGADSEDAIKFDGDNNTVVGNWLGLDSTGTVAIGNGDNAIHLSSSNNNVIGGSTLADRNVIAGSGVNLAETGQAIRLTGTSSNNIIQGNYIGTDKTGTVVLGNRTEGIGIFTTATGNIIGGTAPGEANVIVGSGTEGIQLDGGNANTISGNSIHSNGSLGIELASGNDSQSAPSFLPGSVVSDGITTTVVGSLSSTANKTFTVEFFASDSSSPGGEGEVYMGSAVVTTDGAGNADFTATLSVGVTAGAIITATATNDAGSTSQFSGTVAATGPAIDNAPVANDDAYTVAQDSTLNVDWWDTAWTKRQKLTFDNLRQSEHLYDFPVLVKLTGGYNIDYSQTQANGEDLRFFDADGTALAYEVEEWDENGTSYVWVRVPKVDGWSNTDHIWMYYGNGTAIAGQSPQDVWMPSYQGVWHLSESGTGA
ncbi:MAG: DUF2341 domain-containing protein, partial [Proteobacteria bacterium]|nr:DUF2341 domain-containing protein [Pseudomonadota bacterium]